MPVNILMLALGQRLIIIIIVDSGGGAIELTSPEVFAAITWHLQFIYWLMNLRIGCWMCHVIFSYSTIPPQLAPHSNIHSHRQASEIILLLFQHIKWVGCRLRRWPSASARCTVTNFPRVHWLDLSIKIMDYNIESQRTRRIASPLVYDFSLSNYCAAIRLQLTNH